MKLNKEKQAIIMIIVVVVAMALFAILVKQSIDSNKMVKQTPRVNQVNQNQEIDNQVEEGGEEDGINGENEKKQEKSPLIIEGKKDSSLWTTYKDNDWEFEIDYPEKATLEKKYGDNQFVSIKSLTEDDKDILLNNFENTFLDLIITITVYETNLSLNNWYKGFQPKSDEEQRKKLINLSGSERDFSQDDLVIKTEYFDNYIKHFRKEKKLVYEGFPMTYLTYFFKHDNMVYKIKGETLTLNVDKNLPILEKIIDSFEFIN
jgi:hypothetical protein